MAREFVISAGGITLANQPVSLIFINPAAAPNFNLEFLRYWVSYTPNATSNQQRVELATQVTAFPTLTSATPSKLKKADPNASIITGNTTGAAGTSGINASAEGAGAKTVFWDDGFNVLNGWLHVPTPPETVVMPAGFASGLSLFLPVAPATLTNWAFGLVFREV